MIKSIIQMHPGIEEVFGLLQKGEFEKAHKIAEHLPFHALEDYAKELACWPPYITAHFLKSDNHEHWEVVEGECKRCKVCMHFILYWQGAMFGDEFICNNCEDKSVMQEDIDQ